MTKVFNEEVVFNAPTRFYVLPEVMVDTLISTTPDVDGRTTFKGSGVVATITNFIKGINGQRIHIRGDGTTTVAHNATVKTSTGANKLLASNLMYHFTLIDNIWYEDA